MGREPSAGGGRVLVIVPMSISEANELVDRLHRHHKPATGGLFAVGLRQDGVRVGAAIVGRPVARMLQSGTTAEVVRVAVPEGVPNACSMLYGACARACKALGYTRLITYTLTSESGASLKGAGWKMAGPAGGGRWSRKSRPRLDLGPLEVKVRWEAPL